MSQRVITSPPKSMAVRSAGDGMEKTQDSCEIPMSVHHRRTPRFVPHEPHKAATTISKWDDERNRLLAKIEALEAEKVGIEKQFKLQAKVNEDLKKLLVASLGEDMQTRVQFLSEDKAKLADDISEYTVRLQEDIEQLDSLSIQCDVWRTKYLATSLLVTELAELKANLMEHCDAFEEAIRLSNEERAQLTQQLFAAHRYLRECCSTHRRALRHPSTLTECSAAVLALSAAINSQLTNKSEGGGCVSGSTSGTESRAPSPEIPDATHADKVSSRTLYNYKAFLVSLASSVSTMAPEVKAKSINDVPSLCNCKRCHGTIQIV